ncbi:MAG: LruC domain-containing protein [Maribacter sp.]
MDNKGRGDLAFNKEGVLFMCTFSGLYKLTLSVDGDYLADRISADNLPLKATSMAFHSNQELWLVNSASSSDLIIMETQTGGWEYRYGVNASNNSDLGRAINDLATFRVFDKNQEPIDTDGDGILDGDDNFPDDAEKAFEVFMPSKYGFGTVAFEDLWPYSGDYDFNDVAVNYKVITVQNVANEVVQVDFNIKAKSNRASFVNTFAIEFEKLSPSKIVSVSGQVLGQNYIKLNANGTEANQENAVVVFYDDNNAVLKKPMTISIKLTEPITTAALGIAPFNPLLIINKNREKEIHLPFARNTSLAKKEILVAATNKDPDGNYVTEQGLP